MMPKIACVRDRDSCARSRTKSPGVSGGVRDFVALTAPSVSEPEVRLLDVRALLQRLARAVELEVLAHAHAREELAPLRHMSDAARDHLRAGPAVDALALELDPAPAQGQQAADRPQRCRLAGPVAADERDHLARAHLQRDLAHGHEVAVARLDAIETEQCGHIPRPGTPR